MFLYIALNTFMKSGFLIPYDNDNIKLIILILQTIVRGVMLAILKF